MGIPWWVALAVVLVTAVGVGVAVLNASVSHDWKTCQCVDCRKRRYHAHKAQGHVATGVTADGDIIWDEAPDAQVGPDRRHWLSTAELTPGTVVLIKRQRYRVGLVRSDRKGYLVPLQPVGGVGRAEPVIATV